jgi:isochorismate pyruvate lyase
VNSIQYRRTFSGTAWESKAGYCRALRAGNHIYVSGTAPVDDQSKVYAPGNAYAQAKHCFEIIQTALQNLGADCSCIVRTRMFVTDITRWAEFAQAHQEFFANHPPTTTMVEVQALIDPAMLIEVEAEAVCPPLESSL